MGNQYLTGNNDGIIPEGEGVLWTFDASGQLFNPVSVNGRVYVVSTDNYLYSLDAASGKLLWKFKSEGPLTRMVVAYEGKLYLPAGRFLYCIDEETGAVLWGRRDPSFGFYGTPTVAQGKIFYGNRKGFYARELLNGHLVWENIKIYTYGGFPSYWNGMVFTVSKEFEHKNARLVALNEADGTEKWSTETANAANIFSPVVYDEKIYLSLGNQLMVFEAESGKKLLEKTFHTQVSSNPVFSQGSIFLALKDGTILKINPVSGEYKPLYTVPYGTQFAVVGSYLFIPVKTDRGALDIVDADSGTFVRRIAIGQREPSTLTISRGVVFLPAGPSLLAIGSGELLKAEIALKIKANSRGAKEQEKQEGTRGQVDIAASWGKEQPEGAEGSKREPARTEIERKPAEPETPSPPASTPGTAVPVQERTGAQALESARGEPLESAILRGEVRERDTGKPLSGTVEATTELDSGAIVKSEEPVSSGQFEIEVPREGKTDLLISAPGYAFRSIVLPDEKAIDDLSKQPIEISLSRAKKGERLTVESIYYKTESANLEPGSLGTLQRLLRMMQENPGIKIEIAGHTDSTGTGEFNMGLSERRAEAVASWLIRNGILSKRIAAKGYGDTKPVADNSTEKGRRRNRRTEINIVE